MIHLVLRFLRRRLVHTKGLGFLIVSFDVILDRFDQIVHAF